MFQYFRGTRKLGTFYNGDGNAAFESYADLDWAQEGPDKKSVSGLLFFSVERAIG